MRYYGMDVVIQSNWNFRRSNEIFEHVSRPCSVKRKYAECDTDNTRSHNALSVVTLDHVLHSM